MYLKKTISFVLAIAIMFLCALPQAFGEEPISLAAGTAEGKVGDTVTLTIQLSNNPGFEAFALAIGYDNQYLSPVSASFSQEINGISVFNLYYQDENNQPKINGVLAGMSPIQFNGDFISLQFKIVKRPQNGSTPVTLNKLQGSSIFASQSNELPVTLTDGAVTVTEGGIAPVSVSGIALDKTALSLSTGSKDTLKVHFMPEDATNQNIIWTTSDANTVQVNNGTVTAKAPGNAVITATSADGAKTAQCTVTVTDTTAGPDEQEQVKTPVASSTSPVTLTTQTEGAKIYYTLDGSEPTTASTLYTAPITITPPVTLKAIAVKDGLLNSSVLTVSYPVENKFTDIDGYPWAKDAIENLAALGIIKGTSDTTFGPSLPSKRADYIVLMVRMFGLTADVTEQFSDVPQNAYYYQELGIAKAVGLAQGVGENCFNPEAPISRQDMCTITYRFLKEKGLIAADGSLALLEQFMDASQISDYAKTPLATMVSMNLMVGSNGTIFPQSQATRAELAVFLNRVNDLLS